MAYQHDRDLKLSFSQQRTYWHFVLRVEPPGAPMSAINAHLSLGGSASVYAAEWVGRLVPAGPDAMHVMLVGSNEARKLWDACVYGDPQSPSAVEGDGCVCWQSSLDPVTTMPVAANHYRTVGGDHENWQYHTYALLELPEGQRLNTLIIDNEAGRCWVRTTSGSLHFLPETCDRGYGWGYGGAGPKELAMLIEQIVESDGAAVALTGPHRQPGNRIHAWVKDEARKEGTQEIPLSQLKTLCSA